MTKTIVADAWVHCEPPSKPQLIYISSTQHLHTCPCSQESPLQQPPLQVPAVSSLLSSPFWLYAYWHQSCCSAPCYSKSYIEFPAYKYGLCSIPGIAVCTTHACDKLASLLRQHNQVVTYPKVSHPTTMLNPTQSNANYRVMHISCHGCVIIRLTQPNNQACALTLKHW